MKIDRVLKKKRKEHQLTQEQLAEKIFVSNKTVSNWETDKTTPDIDSLIRLAQLFELSLDKLLLEESEIVTNIKKFEAAKASKKNFALSWTTNILFVFILATQKLYGDISTAALVLLTLAIILNSLVMFYFTKKFRERNNGQTPYQVVKVHYRWLMIPIICVFVLLIWLMVRV